MAPKVYTGLDPIDPLEVQNDSVRTAIIDNRWKDVIEFKEQHGRFGIEILAITDEIIEALRAGKLWVCGDLEYTTIILYRPPEPKE